jgi:hypothetical protein
MGGYAAGPESPVAWYVSMAICQNCRRSLLRLLGLLMIVLLKNNQQVIGDHRQKLSICCKIHYLKFFRKKQKRQSTFGCAHRFMSNSQIVFCLPHVLVIGGGCHEGRCFSEELVHQDASKSLWPCSFSALMTARTAICKTF